MFYIDLDELLLLKKKIAFFGLNRFNFFSFYDKEHLQLPIHAPDTSKNTKQHIIDYLKVNGVFHEPEKIMLLTNLSVLGYNFNPVSFYYCFGKNNVPMCCVAEVSNTFREMKPYLITREGFNGKAFHLHTRKYFYVSPFIAHDSDFDFNLSIPSEKLNIKINDYKNEELFFISTLSGSKTILNNTNLLWYGFRFPFITLQIIFLIHWQAFKLWRKKITYLKKSESLHLQRDVYRKLK